MRNAGVYDQIDLGKLAPGTYAVYLDFVGGSAPVEQAMGILGVTLAPAAPLPMLRPFALLTCCFFLVLLGIWALRERAQPPRGSWRSHSNRD